MKFGFLSKYFPPPKFLKPPHIGISFCDSGIRAISFSGTAENPELKSVLAPLERGSIVAGSIANSGEVVKKLSAIRENFNSPFTVFTIPDELVYVFSASIPVTGSGDMTESVSFIMEENVPLSLGDIVFDFVPTGVVPADSEYNVSVAVAACARREAEKFMEVLRKSGFEPIGCIHESGAIAKAVIPKRSPGTYGVVHARENKVGIHLAKRNAVLFSTVRNITSGDYKKEFLDEYEKFLEYCLKYDIGQNQSMKSVFVCGEFEYAKKAVEAMVDSKDFAKDVKLSNVWANVFEIDKYLPDIPYEKSLGFAGSIGAALSDIM